MGALLQDHLAESPVVWIRGARQVGKSTIAKYYGGESRNYYTFDDTATLNVASADPDGFVAGLPERVTIDEVQRLPTLFRAIKLQVDRRRIDGQFLLTGSANVFALPAANESLAGRMQVLSVEPLAQCEIRGSGGRFVERLYGSSPLPVGIPLVALTREGLWRLIAVGGYPESVKRSSPAARERLFTGYLDTLLERDVRDISQIKRLGALPELLEALASRTGRLLNQTDIGSALSIPRATLERYLAILEALFVYRPQRAYHADAVLSLAKTPKAHLVDTGLACHTLGYDEGDIPTRAFGALAESFCVNELRRLLTWYPGRVRLTHFRTKRAQEVDMYGAARSPWPRDRDRSEG